MNSISRYLSQLVIAQFNNEKPAQLPDDVSVEDVKNIAIKHQMITILLGGLIQTNISECDKDSIRPLIKSSLFHSLAQNAEFTKIIDIFEKEQIMNQPMKGVLLKKIYPRMILREMSDLDILIREECMEHAGEILEQNGFQLKQKIKHHDIYYKEPSILLEAHRTMYDINVDKHQNKYFKDFSKTILEEGCSYTYNYTKEDFYVYMIAHMAKHFYEKGCGIRHLVDIYAYREHYNGQLDEEYIDRELKKCGVLSFAKHMEMLCNIWLKGEESSKFYDDLFQYMLEGGVYGKTENGIWNEFAKEKINNNSEYRKKLKLFYMFPPMHYMVHYYPWINNKKILLPIAWCIRAGTAVLSQSGKDRNKLVQSIDQEEIEMIQCIYQQMDFGFKQ